jgi:ferredoxin
MVNGKAVIDPTKCIGCRRCVDGIPIARAEAKPVQIPLSDSINTALPVQQTSPALSPAPSPTTKPIPPNQNTQSTDLSYRVDSSKCIGCQLCVSACPTGAISMQGDKAVIDQSKCISCGICVNGNGQDYDGCPVGAISRR